MALGIHIGCVLPMESLHYSPPSLLADTLPALVRQDSPDLIHPPVDASHRNLPAASAEVADAMAQSIPMSMEGSMLQQVLHGQQVCRSCNHQGLDKLTLEKALHSVAERRMAYFCPIPFKWSADNTVGSDVWQSACRERGFSAERSQKHTSCCKWSRRQPPHDTPPFSDRHG